MKISIASYIVFLDSVIAECGSVRCLMPSSNAVTRRAKESYNAERDSLTKLAKREEITEFDWEVFHRIWPKLCKRMKYGILRHDYDKPKETPHDMRYPQDGRVVPGYAKDVLAQLRTLLECVLVAIEDKAHAGKVFNTMQNVGKVRYLVNFHDGEKKHKDGSPFFDIQTFGNKREWVKFQNELKRKGYKEA